MALMTSSDKEQFRHRIDRLKEAIDAEQLLTTLGFDISKSTPKEIRAACKVHGGDNKTSFRMNKQTKNWVCFSHACQEDIGYDVISLVMHMLQLSFNDAIKYLESITGLTIHNDADYVEFKRAAERRNFIQHTLDNRRVPLDLVNEEYLNSFKKFRSKFFELHDNGGFSKETLDTFEIGGGYVDKYGFQRDVIPIRDIDGVLVAYSCRDITGKADEDYKYILTEGFIKDKVLYNLHRAKNFLALHRTLIIVEGFKAVWRLYEAGYKNVVACMGSRITSGQQNLLYANASSILILLDPDKAGLIGLNKAIEEMHGKIRILPRVIPYNKDPADLTNEQLYKIIGRI